MKILISIEHPAWVYQFKNLIQELTIKGHDVKIVAINKDKDLELLHKFDLDYELISNTSGKNTVEKAFIFMWTTLRIFVISLKFQPNLYLGRASPMMAVNSFLFRKKHIIFEDSEPAKFSLILCKMFSTLIITPRLFTLNLGKKQVRIDSYKELFYLHPNYFHPNPNILNELNLRDGEKLILVRFVSWSAHHDRGQYGITNKKELIYDLEKIGKVYISSEKPLENDLIKYQLEISIEKIHDVLYYSDIFISDSQTMTTESAILGTPAIRCNTFVGRKDMSNFYELENKYHLIYNILNDSDIINLANSLLLDKETKNKWKLKLSKLLQDKIDPNKYILDKIYEISDK